jgi:hypothetical protein
MAKDKPVADSEAAPLQDAEIKVEIKDEADIPDPKDPDAKGTLPSKKTRA